MIISKWLGRSAGLAAIATPVAALALAAPAPGSNESKAQWKFVERDGDRYCQLRAPVEGAPPYEFADISTTIGRRSFSIRLHGPANGQPIQEIIAGYQIADGEVQTQKSTEYEKDGQRNLGFDFRDEEASAIYKKARVKISVSDDRAVVIDTSGLPKLMKTADACWRQRYVAAGADQKMVANLGAEPEGDLRTIFSYDDYPPMALRSNETGRVSALVIIDRRGRAKDCKVILSSSSAALDEATCNIILRRADIKPGLDRKGRPVDAPTIVNVQWLLP